jgi:hypothetical protein
MDLWWLKIKFVLIISYLKFHVAGRWVHHRELTNWSKVAKKTSLLQTAHTLEKNVISNSRQKKSLKRRASCFFFEVKFKTESCWPIVQKGRIIRRGVSFWPGASGDPQFKTLELFIPTNQVSLTKKPKRPSFHFVSFRFVSFFISPSRVLPIDAILYARKMRKSVLPFVCLSFCFFVCVIMIRRN